MYVVALLVERALRALDVDQILSLHEGLDDTVEYHLLLPVESSTALLAASMGALGNGPVMLGEPEVVDELQSELVRSGQEELDASVALFLQRDQVVIGRLTEDDPVDALKALVERVSADEAIILTEPHVVQEFFHLDWTSRAKRRLDVPTLHLIEHVPLDAQH